MVAKWKSAPVIIYILLLSNLAMGGADAEDKIISSSAEIAALWQDLLSNHFEILIYNPKKHYWYVHKIVLVNNSLSYKINKTNSSVTPYQLVIRFSFNRWHNHLSSRANSDYEYQNRKVGFKTADDALSNIGISDFEEAEYGHMEKISRQMEMTYVLINKACIFKDGNEIFETYIGQHIANVNNKHLFENALNIPIE
jgi:hypothetical protein